MRKTKNILLTLLIALFTVVLLACQDIELEGKITLDKKTMTLVAGSTSGNRITATTENLTGIVTWESSDESIVQVEATINNKIATVKPISEGSATIKALIEGKEATCSVTVTEGAWIKPNQSEVGIEVGRTHKIEYETSYPEDRTPTYTSSNDAVASVNKNGLVTANSEGEAIITLRIDTTTAKVTVRVEEAGVTTDFDGDDVVGIILDLVEVTSYELKAISKGGVDITSGIWSVPGGSNNEVVSITQDNEKVLITAKETGIKKNTLVTFTSGDYSVSVKVTVKAASIKLSFSESYVTIAYNQTTAKLNVVLTPAQTGDDAKVEFTPSKDGIVTIASDGTLTRIADYDFMYNDSVTLTVRATSLIDPEASATATIVVENPDKNSKYIGNADDFINIMTNASNGAADITIKLLANIDLNGHVFTNTVMNGDFRGVLDGNGYTVSNFTAPAMFNHLWGTVKNIGFVASMSGTNGGFLAKQLNQSVALIENCFFNITFTSDANLAAAIGLNNQGVVRNCIILTTNNSSSAYIYAGFVQPTNVNPQSTYYLNQGTNAVSAGQAESKTLAYLQTSSNFSSWNTSIWKIVNGSIPKLINS